MTRGFRRQPTRADLPGESRPVHVEPLVLPEPLRTPASDPAVEPERAPAEAPPVEEPTPA